MRYAADVSACRCRVSYRDHSGVEHAAEVTADSAFLAVAMAVERFRNGLLPVDALPDRLTKLTVEVLTDVSTAHTVALGDVYSYGNQAGDTSPARMMKRARVRKLLEG